MESHNNPNRVVHDNELPNSLMPKKLSKNGSTTKPPNPNDDHDHDDDEVYYSLLSNTKTLEKISKSHPQNNSVHAINGINTNIGLNARDDDSKSDIDDAQADDDNSTVSIDYKLASKSLESLVCGELMSLPLNTQIAILQFVPCDDKFYMCRFVCRYWYHLLTFHEQLPSKQLQFLFPENSKYILSSPFINRISRGNHAMILSSLGLGIYINNDFHLMIDIHMDKDKNKKRGSFDKIQLRHSKKELAAKDIKAISKFLTVNQNIRLIDLSDCNLNDFLLELCCYGIKHNRSVQHLMLSKNRITANGCKYIGYCLQFNQSLRSLWIRSNDIQNEGAKYIAQGLHRNKHLQKLSLDCNNIKCMDHVFYQNSCFLEMESCFETRNVPPIMLDQNEIYTQSYISSYNCVYSDRKSNAQRTLDVDRIDAFLMFAHLMASNRQCPLEVVSLRENNIDSIGLILLTNSLIYNRSLKELHFSYNNIDQTAVFSILSLFKYYQKHKNEVQRLHPLDIYVKSGNKLTLDDVQTVPFGRIF
eukprot:45515_1